MEVLDNSLLERRREERAGTLDHPGQGIVDFRGFEGNRGGEGLGEGYRPRLDSLALAVKVVECSLDGAHFESEADRWDRAPDQSLTDLAQEPSVDLLVLGELRPEESELRTIGESLSESRVQRPRRQLDRDQAIYDLQREPIRQIH